MNVLFASLWTLLLTQELLYRHVDAANVNECLSGLDNCDPYANCVDTQPGFQCNCPLPYVGNGIQCDGGSSRPTFLFPQQPSRYVFFKGSDIGKTLACTASNFMKPELVWEKDGVLLDARPVTEFIPGFYDTEYDIPNAAVKDSGTYVCILTTNFSSKEPNLTVRSPPIQILIEDCAAQEILVIDDFDATTAGSYPDSTKWTLTTGNGVLVQSACSNKGTLSGKSAIFGTTADSSRMLTTHSLTATAAKAIQFDTMTCPYPGTTGNVQAQIEYSINNGPFIVAKSITVTSASLHVVYQLPQSLQTSKVRFRISQESAFSGKDSQVWAVDNFVINEKQPKYLQENFDPLDDCKWLSRPGSSTGIFGRNDNGNALVFNETTSPTSIGRFANTVPLNISTTSLIEAQSEITLLKSNFDDSQAIGSSSTVWASITGGTITTSPSCKAYGKYQAYFTSSGTRQITTKQFDLTLADMVSFWIIFGNGKGCDDSESGEDVVFEYALSGSSSFQSLYVVSYQTTVPTLVNVPLSAAAKTSNTTLRWRQMSNSGATLDTWTLNNVRVNGTDPQYVVSYPTSTVTLSGNRIIFSANFDTNRAIGSSAPLWKLIDGGVITASADCKAYGTYQAFFRGSGDRSLTTQSLDLSRATTLSFYIIIGSGSNGCDNVESGEYIYVEYAPWGNTTFTRMLIIYPGTYSSADQVTISLPSQAKTPNTMIRWRQVKNGGYNTDEWSLNKIVINGTYSVRVSKNQLNFPREFLSSTTFGGASMWAKIIGGTVTTAADCKAYGSSYQAFFRTSGSRYITTVSLDLRYVTSITFWFVLGGSGCDTAESPDSVVMEYALSGSSSFTTFYTLNYNAYTSPTLVQVSLPFAAKTSSTAIRWRQLLTRSSNLDEWSLNYIIFSQSLPSISVVPLLSFPADFVSGQTFGGQSKWKSITGGTITSSADCKVYGTYQAFFTSSGSRNIETARLDLRAAQMLTFYIVIGGSGCKTADAGEDVVLEYSPSGSTVFTLLQTLTYNGYRTAKSVSVALPIAARTKSTAIRWRQLSNSGSGLDQWSLSHIGFHGQKRVNGVERDFVIQFDLYMGGVPYVQSSSSYDVQVQYSDDYGLSWKPVLTPCYPSTSSLCNGTLGSSSYQSVLFTSWKRMQISIPSAVKTNQTEFRWRQPSVTTNTDWSIDNVYVGLRCPKNCHGHGRCTKSQKQSVVCGGTADGESCVFPFSRGGTTYNACTGDHREGELWCSTTANYDQDGKWGYCVCGTCVCDSGYRGKACETPSTPPPTRLRETFEAELSTSKWAWVGGQTIGTRCGVISSGKAGVFYTGRSRILETVDLDLTSATTLQFTFQGGGHVCHVPNFSQERVVVQYSLDGGVLWTLLKTIVPNSLQTYYFSIPAAAQTSSTRIRWYQATASGTYLDVWSIDDVFIDSVFNSFPFFESFEPMSNDLWKFYPNSKVESFCSSPTKSLHFPPPSSASRFLSTSSVVLSSSSFIQFDIVVDCGKEKSPSSAATVTLQYSTNKGSSWVGLDSGCQPSQSGRPYRRNSDYRSGLRSKWNRVTLPFGNTQLIRSQSVQLRWVASTSSSYPYDWAIDNVYVGDGCPNLCNGHGHCDSNAKCVCDSGYSGLQCDVTSTSKPTEIKERFDADPASGTFLTIQGGSVSKDCGQLSSGNALVFNQLGERELVTVDMKATNVKFIQFTYVQGRTSSSSCRTLSSNFQVMAIQYSLDGGVSWTNLKAMTNYSQYRTATIVKVPVPAAARSLSTRFRFFQFGFFSAVGSSAWAIDDLYITAVLPTMPPTTDKPTTQHPTTAKPTTMQPTTAKPTTAQPTTVKPTTMHPTTAKPTTAQPTTVKPTTMHPTTAKPTTAQPTTAKPTTMHPKTVKPTTAKPTTARPITMKLTTAKLKTQQPATAKPTTAQPTPAKTTTAQPRTAKPITKKPVTTTKPPTAQSTTAQPPTAKKTMQPPEVTNTVVTSTTSTCSDLCFNGRVCRNGRCVCLAGYTGRYCEVPINPCLASPCGEKRYCKADSSKENGYTCECLPGYKGSGNECTKVTCGQLPCENGGECSTLSTTLVQCTCGQGFSGYYCETIGKTDTTTGDGNSIPTWAWITLAVGLVLLIVIAIVTVAIVKKRTAPTVVLNRSGATQIANPTFVR